jgi:hypothetical protein
MKFKGFLETVFAVQLALSATFSLKGTRASLKHINDFFVGLLQVF